MCLVCMELFSVHFNKDLKFSEHKDLLLKYYWKEISFEGRFIIVKSLFLQSECGIDVILQGKKDEKELKIDTKHDRGERPNFFLEEESCPKQNKKGWILKEHGWPDYVYYFFWQKCSKCFEDCSICNKELNAIGYPIKFIELRKWFLRNKENYPLIPVKQINGTTGRIVNREELKNKLNLKEKIFKFEAM